MSRSARKHVEASIYGKLEREMNLISSIWQLLARSLQITRRAIRVERQSTLPMASYGFMDHSNRVTSYR